MIATPSVQLTTPSVTLDTLRQMVAELGCEYPESGSRVERAAQLVLFHNIERGSTGAWFVPSLTDDTRDYCVLTYNGNRICQCADFTKRGVQCQHLLATRLVERLERREAEANDPTLVPIDYLLTPAALTALDEARQRDAARCPDCNEWKQHGQMYCGGDVCERPRPALRLVAVDGAARP